MAFDRQAASPVLLDGSIDLLERDLLEGLRELMRHNRRLIRVPEDLRLSAAEH